MNTASDDATTHMHRLMPFFENFRFDRRAKTTKTQGGERRLLFEGFGVESRHRENAWLVRISDCWCTDILETDLLFQASEGDSQLLWTWARERKPPMTLPPLSGKGGSGNLSVHERSNLAERAEALLDLMRRSDDESSL